MTELFEITQVRGVALATIMARGGFDADALDLPLPNGPRCVTDGALMLVGTGAGVWLAVSETPDEAWPETLERRVHGHGSVSDQSGSYVVFRIAGPGAGALLQRGAAIDLNPGVFVAGTAATTVIGHIGVILWRASDAAVFDVAVFRSYAESFRHWIDAQRF